MGFFMVLRLFLVFYVLIWISGCTPTKGIYHTVDEGQTLYRISRVYGVNEQYLARVNGIDDPSRLKVGQKLFIPGAEVVHNVPKTLNVTPIVPDKPQKQLVVKKSPPAPPVSKPNVVAPTSTPTPRSNVTSTSSRLTATSESSASPQKGLFIWPLKGKILKGFGESHGTPSKGLEIAAPRGTPVVSASAGRVIYSGNGIRGYGNLIILKHDDSYFTVYGFNDKNLVKNDAFVSKGEKIALSGVPPSGGEARLHFEIRHGKEAVNPSFYLP